MKEPSVNDIEIALRVLSYYEQEAEKQDEGMLRALMADSQSHIRSYSPIVIDDREKYEQVMDMK